MVFTTSAADFLQSFLMRRGKAVAEPPHSKSSWGKFVGGDRGWKRSEDQGKA
jgi:hypothetical protein